ncbi:MAG TPA: tetratricopeptide repeat protein [Pyrinomonadaceae bacterium]|nr:tetratricopeptide repeat protein [Pyrinomonadaceae bacterium]
MKRFVRIFSIVLLVLLAPAKEAVAGETWTKVVSKNFTLIGNADEREIRQVAARLEQFREVFSRLSGNQGALASVPTTVIVFRTEEAFRPYKPLYRGRPSDAAGFFQSGSDTNYITLSTEHRAGEAYRIIFHEYVHLLVNDRMGDVPVWFNEGLAEYYSTVGASEDGARVWLGFPVRSHLATLRDTGLIPLRTLFSVEQDSPYYNERDKNGIFYAESWALVHYLLQANDGARASELYRFIELLGAGKPQGEAFTEAFGTDVETLEKELAEYVRRASYTSRAVTFPSRVEFDAGARGGAITESEALAHLGDLLLHLKRLDDADARLQEALRLDPHSALAHCALGLVRAKQKRYSEARAHLKLAVTENPDDYLLHYKYAYAVSREGMDEEQTAYSYTTDDAELMRAELRRAMELRPDFPESYHLLAFVNLVRDEQLDESFTLIRRAIELSPGREELELVLAQLHMRKRDWTSARAVLEPIAGGAASRQVRERAVALLNTIRNMENYLAQLQRTADEERAHATQNESPAEHDAVAEATGLPVELVRGLRHAEDGEAQMRGLLVKIDCAQSAQGVIIVVQTGGRTLKLHSDELRHIRFTTYTTEVRGIMTCGGRNPANDVFITYRPAPNSHLSTEGEVVAIEFLPREISLN